ncbi:MAG: hypothetical protein PHX61_01835 [Alphaproteobacteria bacterium]|nr:hypothetical protein [Alphaproteobacteria bacterium]
MAGFWEDLKSSSSYRTLVRAMDAAPTPVTFINRMMDLTHETKVLKDGIAEGTASTIGYALGLPQTIYRFYKEQTEDKKFEAPPEDQKYSSEWFKKQMMGEYEDNLEILGKTRPELRAGTNDGYIHFGGQMVPLVGSFFIPGGQALGASKVAHVIGTVAPKAGIIGFAAETGIEGYEGYEYVKEEYGGLGGLYEAEIEPVAQNIFSNMMHPFGESAPAQNSPLAADNQSQGIPHIKFGTPTAPSQSQEDVQVKTAVQTNNSRMSQGQIKMASYDIAEPHQGGPSPNSSAPEQTAKILGLALGNDLIDSENPTQFSKDGVHALQELLTDKKLYTHTIDDIAGKYTMQAADKAIKDAIKPSSLTEDLRAQYETRMKDLAKDLREQPANPYGYDPRVMALQTCGYALGLYNKNIDGLAGDSTMKAIHLIENKELSETKPIMATQQNAPAAPAPVV